MARLFTAAVLTLTLGLAAQASARESWVGLNVRAQIAYIEMNKFNQLNWGAGAEASFFPNKRLLLQGRYSSSYFTNGNATEYEDYYLMPATPELKPFTSWEAGAQINLIVRTGKFGNTTQRYDSTTSGRDRYTGQETITTHSTKYSWLASEHQLYGIRAGVLGLESGMPADLGKDDDTILDADGTAVDPNLRDLTFTNHTMSGFYLGLAKTRVYYNEGLWRTVYADVLVAGSLEYKDPELSGFTESKYGGRIGVEGARRHLGGRVEAGIRPGVDGFYVLTQFSLGFML